MRFIDSIEVAPPTPIRILLTDDSETILRFAADGAELSCGSALVTLVEIRGGTSRALGAQMAVRGDGSYCGFVSGGCVEAAVATEAIAAIQKGVDRFVVLGAGSLFFDIVLPCGGGITVAIHVVREVKPLRDLLGALACRARASLTYHTATETIEVMPYRLTAKWVGSMFVRPYRPAPRVMLFGTGIELEATSKLAIASEYPTVLYEGRLPSTVKITTIDMDTAVAVLYHDLSFELPVLEAALRNQPFYIGALGSRHTHAKRCAKLLSLGYSQADIDRIKAPIGMFGPAKDARTLAVSILADIAMNRVSS